MKDGSQRINFNKLKRYSLKDRFSKVDRTMFAKTYEANSSFKTFLNCLPNTLKSTDMKDLVDILSKIIKQDRMLILGMGGHVIKVGLSPIIIDMISNGLIKHIVFNGSCMIHDFEVAYNSSTSENVDLAIENGSFGMSLETGKFINDAILVPHKGLGYNVGKYIHESDFINKDLSILAACYKNNVPATVHVAFGTDIIHCHPEFNPEKTGIATHEDFKKLTESVSYLEGGAFLNIGSAVIIPEVFLKSITVSRNLGFSLKELYTANFDFLHQYRTQANVVKRPTSLGGKGYNFIGHHELLVPFFYACLKEKLREWDEE